MPAKNIECQLAQGQIGRYLSGGAMSAEAISQLEFHIAECPDCSEFVDNKKKTLRELAASRHAVVEMPELEVPVPPAPEPTPTAPANPTQTLLQAIREKANPLAKETILETAREQVPEKKTYWKTLAFSLALGAVLLAMSHFSANPSALFGERVGAPDPAKSDPKSEVKTLAPIEDADRDPFTAEAPIGAARTASSPPSDAADGQPTLLDPVAPRTAETAAKPKATISVSSTPTRPRTNVRARRNLRAAPRNRPAPRGGNSIRVYDANGNPL